jgi:hypothetical protein
MLCDGTEILTLTFIDQFLALEAIWDHNAVCMNPALTFDSAD